MTVDDKWASLEDFATLFGYFWHRDFPIDPEHAGAHPADWTKHIDQIIRNISNLFGLYVRYEWTTKDDKLSMDGDKLDGPKDAVIRDAKYQSLIALEWEWQEELGIEIDKLKKYAIKVAAKVNGKDSYQKQGLKYCVLITYSHSKNIDDIKDAISQKWRDAICPLLLILVVFENDEETNLKWTATGRAFRTLIMTKFFANEIKEIRTISAFPWEINGTKWYANKRRYLNTEVVKKYIEAALSKVKYEVINDEEPYYGEIPDLQGVWATGKTKEECRNNLAEVLDGWLVIRLKRGLAIPPMGGYEIGGT